MNDRAVQFVLKAVDAPPRPGDNDWHRVLQFADRTQMTLLLRNAPAQPTWLQGEIDTRAAKNVQRLRRLQEAYGEISMALLSAGIDFILMKGFSHAAFGVDPLHRLQYDIDLFCEPARVGAAADAIQAIGYVPHSQQSLSDQHLPPFVKPHQWQWRGDYFDPDMPIAIELHTKLWEPGMDRIHVSGPDLFWNRRLRDVPWFGLPDRLAYAALHGLRHIIRNDARPAHIFELACFLDARVRDRQFWDTWKSLHDRPLRRAQAMAFRFAIEWFRCETPEVVADEIEQFSAPVRAWFEEFAWSPVFDILLPNKHVVWLHLAMLDSLWDSVAVLRRRVLPVHAPRTHGATSMNRVRHHASAIVPVLASGLRWWRRCAMA